MYKGQWNKRTGEREGVGLQTWPDGSKYEGFWHKGLTNGKGRMTHANGDIYEGMWVADRANGFGVFIDVASEAKYEGYWVDDMQHGDGIETWGRPGKPGATYVGQFFKGKKQGRGRF